MSSSPDTNDSGALQQGDAAPGAIVPRPRLAALDVRQALAPLPPALSAAPNVLSLVKALRRRLTSALSLGLLLAATAGTAAWFLMPAPKISARTTLQVFPSQPAILQRTDQDDGGGFGFVKGQISTIKSTAVLRAALRQELEEENPERENRKKRTISDLHILRQLSPKMDRAQWLEEKLLVENSGQEFITIKLSGDEEDRADLTQIVNAVASAYRKFSEEARKNNQGGTVEELQKVEQKFRDRLAKHREQLRKLEEDNGPGNNEAVTFHLRMVAEDQKEAERNYRQVREKIRLLHLELGLPVRGGPSWQEFTVALSSLPIPLLPTSLTSAGLYCTPSSLPLPQTGPLSLSPESDPKLVDQLVEKDKEVMAQRFLIRELKAKIEGIRKQFKSDGDPKVEKNFQRFSSEFRRQLDTAEKKLDTLRKELIPQITEQLRKQAEYDARSGRLKKLHEYTLLKQMEQMYYSQIVQLDEEAKRAKKNAFDAGQLRDAVDSAKALWKKADDKLEILKVEQQAPARVNWSSDYTMILSPNEIQIKLLASAAASLGSLALVLLGFSWLEFRHRKINSPEEVVQSLGLPLVGTVPDLSKRAPWLRWLGAGNKNDIYAQHLLTESVDAARALVLHTARSEPLQIVMITSALAGEGKTSLASHLAASLGRSGRRTLLIDCDLRNPALHRLFDLERAPGLSELLRGEIELGQATRATVIGNLSIITAGHGDGAALQALSRDGIRPIFEQLRQQYDFIVVDSCPVLPVADSLLVGQHSDAVIFSLLREVSRLPKVYAAYQRLALLGIHMLGAVVNGTREDVYVGDYNYVSPQG